VYTEKQALEYFNVDDLCHTPVILKDRQQIMQRANVYCALDVDE
jgi:hypothetical protein